MVPLLLTLTLIAATPVAAAPHPHPDADASVIATWNEMAVTTITAGGPSPTAFNYFAFTHLAMYNAVVAITGEYELYQWDAVAPKVASPEAAAAAAAHRVLVNYFPANTANLDAQLAASLARVRNPVARANGVEFGVLAANHIIALRTGDGRNAAVTVPPATGPGDWEPTLPGLLPFSSAWLGGVKPLALDSHDRFDPGAPPEINSPLYLTEFNEVRDYGKVNSTVRTGPQTQTALFFSDAGIVPMQRALQNFALGRGLDIDDSARMFAAVETAIADGAGTVWNAKLQYMWWRPITAIRAADDGNPDTVGDANWLPRITNPAYPEWPSGLCSVVGAASTVLERLNGDGTLGLTITSGAANETRTYATKAQISQEAIDARVWSGIHFRTADVVSIGIGTNVANWVLDNYFQPTD